MQRESMTYPNILKTKQKNDSYQYFDWTCVFVIKNEKFSEV